MWKPILYQDGLIEFGSLCSFDIYFRLLNLDQEVNLVESLGIKPLRLEVRD